MIIVVGGIKGGSGKSTLATNLTVMRALNGKKVLLIDADEQKSSSTWADLRDRLGFTTPWTTIQLAGASIRAQVQKMNKDYDDIIIDVGGRDTTSQRSALTVADIYLVPFQPRSLDIWTIGDVKSLISEISAVNDKLQAYAIINRGDALGADNKDAMELLADCPNLTCLPIVIGQRKAFANAASDGLGIVEMKVQDKKAISEIQALYQMLYS
jgi:chromosome partitioning protein